MVLLNLQFLDVDQTLKAAARKRYKVGAAGRAAAARYRARPETKTYMRAYGQVYAHLPGVRESRAVQKKTPAGRAAQARYKSGEAGKAACARRYRAVTRGREYGLTPAQVEDMFLACGGVCETCGREMSRTRVRGGLPVACIDHDHLTGVVRGMLCVACNTTLGKMYDSPERLRTLAEYLEKHR